MNEEFELPRSYASSVTRKGQVTVPIEIRRRLGLGRGDRVVFEDDGNTVWLRPADSVAARTAGALKQYRRVPSPSPDEEREAFAEAVGGEALGATRN